MSSSTCLRLVFTNESALALTQLLFHQQSYAQLYQYTQLEVTPNFYTVCWTLRQKDKL